MPIAFQCPKCGKRFKVGDELAGKQAKCPCGTLLQLPGARPASPAAGPATSEFSDFLDEALSQPLPSGPPAAQPLPPAAPPPRPVLRPVPSFAPGPVYAEGYARPRRRGEPGMVSRALVGGFMIFIGGLGLLGAPIACIGLALVLIGAAPLPASGFPEGLRWLLWGDVLIGLGISAMGIFASYFYLSGGIGIIQGRSAGAEKGGNAAALSLGLIGIRAVWAIFVVIVASQHAGDRGPGAGPIIVGILILALIVSVIPGALLLWCNSAGQRLPD